MRIYFVRHGESHANIQRQISNRGLTHGLTRKGREQANALADKLTGQAISHIYSSPMLRAIETSILLGNRLDVDYTVTDALREFDCGIAEGRADLTGWQLWQGIVDDWVQRNLWDRRIEGGESFEDLRGRFVPFVEGLVRELGTTDVDLIFVGHGGIYYLMLPLVVKNVDRELFARHRLGNAACIVTESREQGLVCIDWNGEKI